jgi:hypothetical protein
LGVHEKDGGSGDVWSCFATGIRWNRTR